eukprot:gene28973-32159_t
MDDEFPFPVVSICTEKHGEGWAASRDIHADELVLRVSPAVSVPTDASCHVLACLHAAYRQVGGAEESVLDQFGPDDAMMDNVGDDVDQLMGDVGEDLPEPVLQKYVEAHLNGIDITAPPKDPSVRGSQGKTIGEAIYPSAARFNHSCQPSCGLSFDAWGCLRVTALQRVRRGVELTICYVDPKASRAARRARLKEQYGFDCDCVKCGRGM